MTNPTRILRNAGFCFTWRRMSNATVRVSLWRVDPADGQRHWVTCAFAADDRDAIRARALALMTWARTIPTAAGQDVQAQAVATSLAITAHRMARLERSAISATCAAVAGARRHAA
ncbi:MAG: hypothetical protein JWM10_4792 [Myxococcaceae bacterium]|nr:hypothetical protein [Myxococcaceae bacterium]